MEEKNNPGNTVIAVIVCMLIWVGWQFYLEKKYPQPKEQIQEGVNTNKTTVEKTNNIPQAMAVIEKGSKTIPQKPSPAQPEKIITFSSQDLKIEISTIGAVVKQAELTQNKILLVNNLKDKGLLQTKVHTQAGEIDFSDTSFLIEKQTPEQVLLVATKDNITIKKALLFNPKNYSVNTTIEVLSGANKAKAIDVFGYQQIPDKESTSFFSFSPPVNYQEYYFKYKNKTERDVVHHDTELKKEHEQVHVAAIGSRYFTSLFLNKAQVLPQAEALRDQNQSVLKIKYPLLEQNQQVSFDLFLGPKSLNILKKLDDKAADVIDYGMFSWIALPLLGIMKWFYSLIGNYGIAIILLTILVRILTFPFTYVSYKSMKAMQVIQPEINRLKEKYKGDNKTLNVEMMKLMRENKVNPAGGCVPMLLQLPIFWALYQVLQNSIELYKSPFYLWIHDLSQKDPYYVLPVLMGAAMFIQQKMMPSTMDPAQQKVMLFMPVFFAFLMFGLPSGLTLYILISTVFGIIQQIIMSKDAKQPQKA